LATNVIATNQTGIDMSKRILIVDDQETIVLFLRERLEKLGFDVSTASNGVEGLEVLRTESINGILLDLEMPIMDGLTMLNRLRQRSSTVPVIVMSADPTRTTMIKAIEGGARDYLFKPISGEILKHKRHRIF
jgi:DNA-binding response OmpR family regulator